MLGFYLSNVTHLLDFLNFILGRSVAFYVIYNNVCIVLFRTCQLQQYRKFKQKKV